MAPSIALVHCARSKRLIQGAQHDAGLLSSRLMAVDLGGMRSWDAAEAAGVAQKRFISVMRPLPEHFPGFPIVSADFERSAYVPTGKCDD